MALLRNMIPDNVSQDSRVKIDLDPKNGFWAQFGLNVRAFDPDKKKLYFKWIRENCQGYVYWVEYELSNSKKVDYVIEFFFKTVADAILFKLAFG